MRNQKGYVAGYNGQAVVTANQVIVGAMLSWNPVGRTLLHPLPGQCRDPDLAAPRSLCDRLKYSDRATAC
jgi:hypothetical protein